MVGEYRSQRQAALLEPASGDPLFVGGEPQPANSFNGESDRDFNWSRLQRMSDGFFLKLAYQVRP